MKKRSCPDQFVTLGNTDPRTIVIVGGRWRGRGGARGDKRRCGGGGQEGRTKGRRGKEEGGRYRKRVEREGREVVVAGSRRVEGRAHRGSWT